MAKAPFRLWSDAFGEGEFLPSASTCDGEDLSPPLQWQDPPQGTRSLAIVVTDAEESGAGGGPFTHWLLYDLPPDLDKLPEGARGVGVAGRNDAQSVGWRGPCPPPRGGDHRYRFTLFALDCETLGLGEGAAPARLAEAMEGHVLGRAELTGRYRR